ncbi:MAG: hypothetical protein HUJ90_00550 [Bacteroidales bacterium]|nr:hypothetical protein [Bacteroidales bacterium]
MASSFDIRRYFYPVILLAIAFYVSAFFIDTPSQAESSTFFMRQMFGPIELSKPLSIAFATLSILAVSALVSVTNAIFSTGINRILSPIFLIMVYSQAGTLYFTPIHFAIVFFAAAVASSVYMKCGREGGDNSFVTSFFISAASLFFIPLIWLAPVFFLVNLDATNDKLRYIVNSVCGIAATFALMIGCLFIFYDADAVEKAYNLYLEGAVAINPSLLPIKTASLLRNLVIAAVLAKATAYVLTAMRRFGLRKARVMGNILGILAATIGLAILFTGESAIVWIVPYLPASILLFEFFSKESTGNNRSTAVLSLFLLLALIIDRVIWLV